MTTRPWSRLHLHTLWRKVHPDLFQNHPKAQIANQRSMQELMAYLETAAQCHESRDAEAVAGCNLNFFIASPGDDVELHEVNLQWSAPGRSYKSLSKSPETWANNAKSLVSTLAQLVQLDPTAEPFSKPLTHHPTPLTRAADRAKERRYAATRRKYCYTKSHPTRNPTLAQGGKRRSWTATNRYKR